MSPWRFPQGPAQPGLGDPLWEQGRDSAVSATPGCTQAVCRNAVSALGAGFCHAAYRGQSQWAGAGHATCRSSAVTWPFACGLSRLSRAAALALFGLVIWLRFVLAPMFVDLGLELLHICALDRCLQLWKGADEPGSGCGPHTGLGRSSTQAGHWLQ